MSVDVPSPELKAVAPSRRLLEQLAGIRRKQIAISASEGSALLLAAATLLFALQMLLDWWLEFPFALRGILLAGDALVAAAILWRWIFRPIIRPLNDEDAALLAERRFPQFRTRLIAAVQLSQPSQRYEPAAADFVFRTVASAEKAIGSLKLDSAVDTARFRRTAMSAAAVLGIGLCWFAYGRAVNVDLLRRVFLANIPVPRKTRVVWTTGDVTAGRGDTVRLEARAAGIIPKKGRVTLNYASGPNQELTLEKGTNAATFARTIENVPESFSYVVQLNDGRSLGNRVTVVARPSVKSLECVQIYPAYTGLGNTARAAGDLNLLVGSRLQLKIGASKEIRQGALRLVGLNQQTPLQLDRENSRRLSGEFLIASTNLAGFSVQLMDRDGMESKDGAVYRVEVIPDKRPLVRLLYPQRKEELATRGAVVLISFEAEDDFGIAKAALHFRGTTEKKESIVELDLSGRSEKVIRHRFEWRLSTIAPALKEGTVLEYWISATDINNVTGPGVGQSEHYQLKIVSAEEKRADLMKRAEDFLGTIGDVTTEQEKLNENLGTLIRARLNP